MNNKTTDGAAVRVPPPLSYLAVLATGIALNELIWPLPLAFSGSIRLALALAIAVPSIALGAGALRLFRATGQDPKPWVATPEIVRTGVYRFTRNPMYLGFALLQAAIGIGLGNLWVVLLVPFSLSTRPDRGHSSRGGVPRGKVRQRVSRLQGVCTSLALGRPERAPYFEAAA